MSRTPIQRIPSCPLPWSSERTARRRTETLRRMRIPRNWKQYHVSASASAAWTLFHISNLSGLVPLQICDLWPAGNLCTSVALMHFHPGPFPKCLGCPALLVIFSSPPLYQLSDCLFKDAVFDSVVFVCRWNAFSFWSHFSHFYPSQFKSWLVFVNEKCSSIRL